MIEYVDGKGKPHEIDNCPFCGRAPRIIWLDCEMCECVVGGDETAEYGGIVCEDCDVIMKGQIILSDDILDVIRRWNTRVRE